jgi:hypothetical protein
MDIIIAKSRPYKDAASRIFVARIVRGRMRLIEPGFKQTTKIPESIERRYLLI